MAVGGPRRVDRAEERGTMSTVKRITDERVDCLSCYESLVPPAMPSAVCIVPYRHIVSGPMKPDTGSQLNVGNIRITNYEALYRLNVCAKTME